MRPRGGATEWFADLYAGLQLRDASDRKTTLRVDLETHSALVGVSAHW